ncbi:MAG: PD-(D/E)XK nuclease family protein [Candidatus Moranbacteria bacterium]|nr:PD-(D/E)XK nuclease family protein [Candidatus Moranbacteria bacterium]
MRISYSGLEAYRNCPLKYRFQYVENLKEPKSREQVFGTIIHSVLRYIHTPASVQPTLDQALNQFSQLWNGDAYENETEERAAFSQGVKIISDYYAKNDPGEATIVDLESRFALEIGDDSTGRHVVAGIVDRIDATPSGFEIIDYKTARKMPSQEKVDNDLQLSIYLRAFLDRYPKETEHLDRITVSLYYLRHGVKLSSTRTREQLADLDRQFLAAIGDIEAAKFDPILSPLCEWCGYRRYCPFWKHKYLEEHSVDDDGAQKAIEEILTLRDRMKGDKLRYAQLSETLLSYMEGKEVERVFGSTGIVGKSVRRTWKYDEDRLREVLVPLDKWDAVRKVDGTALRGILPVLPLSARKEVEAAKVPDKESVSLTIKKARDIEALDESVVS